MNDQTPTGTTPPGDRDWLRLAIDLSRRCPPSATAYSVGAIVVAADGSELSRGYSREDDPHVHAEEAALARIRTPGDRPAGVLLAGATLYSSLEPCTTRRSRARTCTALILASGITRVVIAWREPSVLVADCRGAETLSAAGLTVVEIPELGPAAAQVNLHIVGGRESPSR